MANVQKYDKQSCPALFAHFMRNKNKNGEYVKFANGDIDLTRSHLNYNLAPVREMSQYDFLKKRLSEVRCLQRKDVKVMANWVVTLPKYEILRNSVSPADASRLFFERCYTFLADRYGEENVISAYVHMDERTPHMHFSFIPVCYDPKRKVEKVCAKEVLNKQELTCFHTDLEKYLDSFKDIAYQILNGATRDGNKEMSEFKRDMLAQEISEKETKVEELRQEVQELDEEKTKLLTAKEVKELQGQRTLFGGLKGISFSEYEALKRTAEQVETIEKQKNQKIEALQCQYDLIEELLNDSIAEEQEYHKQMVSNQQKEIQKVRASVQQAADQQIAGMQGSIAVLEDKVQNLMFHNSQLQYENNELTSENSSLKTLLRNIQKILRDRFPQVYRHISRLFGDYSHEQGYRREDDQMLYR